MPSPPYLAGRPAEQRAPLSRYLPLHEDGVAARWLAEHVPPGNWVLDPFGASPRLVAEIAHAGYRVLTAMHNPITAFVLRLLAEAPGRETFNHALAALAAARAGDQRLEPLLRDLYRLPCPGCRQPVEAQAFLWEREAAAPYGALLHCPACHTQGEFPLDDAERRRAAEAVSPLHRARVLERVAPLNDPDRPFAEQALDAYPPRSLYALTTLINKMAGLFLSPEQETALQALLLAACDRGSTLWPHPKERQRPRQLGTPPRYRENNLWLALEEAADLWPSGHPGFPLVHWPELPPESGGACLFEGRFKSLAADLRSLSIAAVVTALPRPNQAFWTLSALWSGWLWGAEAAREFKSVLRRQRFTWQWHTLALHAVLDALHRALPPDTPLLALMSEAEPGFLAAAALSARLAGFPEWQLALRAGEQQAQIHMQATPRRQTAEATPLHQIIQERAHAHLWERGEPATHLTLVAAGLGGVFQSSVEAEPRRAYTRLQDALQRAISSRGGLRTFSAAGHWWWLTQPPDDLPLPLADRVEIELVRALVQHTRLDQSALEERLLATFPGLLTPESDLLRTCLHSYARLQNGRWTLNPQDQPAQRRADLQDIAARLTALGEKLGFRVQQSAEKTHLLYWSRGEERWEFHLRASAVLGESVQPQRPPQGRAVLVIPGGRANLLAFKLQHNPWLAETVEAHWLIARFRQVRALADTPHLTTDNLIEKLSQAPPTYDEAQLRLF